jgi:diguanylate cyclase (GGDEF)-like protein/PAS domain S-box-containing protein
MSLDHKAIVLIDDNPDHAHALGDCLFTSSTPQSRVEWFRTLSGGLKRIGNGGAGVIFLNLLLPDSRGIETLDKVLSIIHTYSVIVLAGADAEATCKIAMTHGAQDYLLEGHMDSYSFARALRGIDEREEARRALFGEKERAQVTLNSIGDAVLSTDIVGNVTYLNIIAEKMTGWSCADAVGQPIEKVFRIVNGITHQPAANPLKSAINENRVVELAANSVLIRRDGHESAIEDSAAPIRDGEGKVAGGVVVFHDVSMARSRVLEMSHLAQHDGLTDLPNRVTLTDRLTQAISLALRNRDRLAVLFVDLDGFKNVNDSLGHSIGDGLLQSVAQRLIDCVRKSDTVSRQGGDEFVILLPEVRHEEDAAVSAAKILAELRKPHVVEGHSLSITASIGISTYPEHGTDADTLIKSADAAMYQVKRDGRDNFKFFKLHIGKRAVERQSVEGQLRYALERRELVLHYQPKVNLKTRAITSVEALIRWQHPERGLLLPDQFLKIAEDSGMIVPIGQWVLGEACRQMREWLNAGVLAVPVAVNISSLELCNKRFAASVQAALREARLEPRYLELELTETVLMQGSESNTSMLEQLQTIGVRLAVDDFGTGYSSLSYLTRLPIDTLKIDRSFIHNVVAKTGNSVVLSAIIDMGNRLKHRVIAEGVETLEQLSFLRSRGCPEGQGYYFSRPVTANQFAKLVETGMPEATPS